MRNNFINVITEEAVKNKDIVLVTGDLGFNVLNKFEEKCPNQFINAGIAEQNMTSVAAGLALSGKKVFTYSIGNFCTLRCLEQIRNDICYHNADVKIISLAAGFAYGNLGMSHHATEDIACLRSLPNMTLFSPCDPIETRLVAKECLKLKGPCAIRLGRGGEPNLWDDNFEFEIGKCYQMYNGENIAILSTGAITKEAKEAVLELRNKGINIALFTFPTIKPMDKGQVIDIFEKYKFVITLEEHNKVGGFGGAISEIVSQHDFDKKPAKLHIMGLNDEFTSVVGSTEYLRNYYKLDKKAIIEVVEDYING